MDFGPIGIAENLEVESPNVYHAGPMGMEALWDKIIVVEDDFKSGYECEACNKTGDVVCSGCDGTGKSRVVANAKCVGCSGSGKVACIECKGKGELLVIPDTAKRRPTTGLVVSVGPDVLGIELGMYVCYSNFCGEVWDLEGIGHDGIERSLAVRHMKAKEVICKVTGHLSLRRLKNRANQTSG